jgi:large subunit ribosomal protein L27Ae
MRHFHYQRNHYFNPIINLDKLWTLVGEEVGVGGRANGVG